MKELSIEAKTDNLDTVLEFISAELIEAKVSVNVQTQIAIAAEEIFVNIAHYAYAPATGTAVLRITVSDTVVIEFEDSGEPYNPLAKTDPNITLSADEREIGGLGIYMVKNMMDNVTYKYENGNNILTLTKGI